LQLAEEELEIEEDVIGELDGGGGSVEAVDKAPENRAVEERLDNGIKEAGRAEIAEPDMVEMLAIGDTGCDRGDRAVEGGTPD
jgi:hypothetical protein